MKSTQMFVLKKDDNLFVKMLRSGSEQMIFDDLEKLPQLGGWNAMVRGVFLAKCFSEKKKTCFAIQRESDMKKTR